jgi:hypothetical protein
MKYNIPNIQLYQRGICIVVWFDKTYHQYWDYTQAEAIRFFKKKYGIKGSVDRVNFCPFILN